MRLYNKFVNGERVHVQRSCFMNKLRHYSLSLIGYYKDE